MLKPKEVDLIERLVYGVRDQKASFFKEENEIINQNEVKIKASQVVSKDIKMDALKEKVRVERQGERREAMQR